MWNLKGKFSPFIDWLLSTDDEVERGVDAVWRWFSAWFPLELKWCWLWLRATLFACWNWLYDEFTASEVLTVCALLPLVLVAKPLIWSDSAIDMNDCSSACFTFTSPWYINCSSSDMIENETSLRMTARNGSKQLMMNLRYRELSVIFVVFLIQLISYRDE